MFQSTGAPNSRGAKVNWHPRGPGGLPLLQRSFAVDPDPSHDFDHSDLVVNLEDDGEYSVKDDTVDATVGGRQNDFDRYQGREPSLADPLLPGSRSTGKVGRQRSKVQRFSTDEPRPSPAFDNSDGVVNLEDDGKYQEEDYGVHDAVGGRPVDFDLYQGSEPSLANIEAFVMPCR